MERYDCGNWGGESTHGRYVLYAEAAAIIAEIEAENERLKGGTRGASSRWKEIETLREDNERLRKELASWRKGECRRKIDKAMEGE